MLSSNHLDQQIDFLSNLANSHSPVQAFWEYPEQPGARCVNEGPVTLAGGLVKILVDLLITTLPIPLVLRMNMQRRQRYGVAFLLGLGYIVTTAGAVRSYYTWKTFYGTEDRTWFQYPAFLAAVVENDVAVVRSVPASVRVRPLSCIDLRLSPNAATSTSTCFRRANIQNSKLGVLQIVIESDHNRRT
jgi:hypothetical protein